MSIEITDIHNNRGNIISFRGDISWNEFHAVITNHLDKSPETLQKYQYSIVDYRDVKSLKVVASDVFKIAKHCLAIAPYTTNTKIALIRNESTSLKYFDLWKTITAPIGWHVQLFTTLSHAAEWLEAELSHTGIRFSDQFKKEWCLEETSSVI